MVPAKLICPYATYESNMYIRCGKVDNLCAHQRWCASKGWAVLTDMASRCTARTEPTDENNGKGDNSERRTQAAPKRRNKV